ncbi:hypothetical protein BC792_11043 [Sphingobacterium allocomposti]|uniref:Uncharacterized protein n=1 Tax=Sphingobacterium allocomposti TaxID=415956 RepID=A0A5S5DKN7_9SPHI|nr:hypothetical protein BC792_11043 [Sphingobacterium composti Yoo et al. 2007 non Ten et al. 2007]
MTDGRRQLAADSILHAAVTANLKTGQAGFRSVC